MKSKLYRDGISMRIGRAFMICAASVIAACTPAAPADQAMIDNFRSHRGQFEQLREMVCNLSAPQVVMMNPERSTPPISPAEKQKFYTILKGVGANGVQGTPQPCSVSVEVWSSGLGGDGDYKKYRFGPPVQHPMIDSQNLDADGRSRNEISFYQRQIEGAWWLEFDHWP